MENVYFCHFFLVAGNKKGVGKSSALKLEYTVFFTRVFTAIPRVVEFDGKRESYSKAVMSFWSTRGSQIVNRIRCTRRWGEKRVKITRGQEIREERNKLSSDN